MLMIGWEKTFCILSSSMGVIIHLQGKNLQASKESAGSSLIQGITPRMDYSEAITRNSSAAATVTCGAVVAQLQLLPDVLVQE
jgi:hypothetical protein